MRILLFIFCIFLSIESEAQENSGFVYSDIEFITKWYQTIFPLTEAEAATVSARNLAYIDIAFYECTAIASPTHISMSKQLNDFVLQEGLIKKRAKDEYTPALAANRAMMKVSLEMFHHVSSRLLKNVIVHADSIDLYFKFKLDKKNYESSNILGEQIADVIILWAKKDGGHGIGMQPYDIYFKNKTNCDSCWILNERAFKFGGPLTPNWGNNRLFVSANETINISPKITFSKAKNSPFYQQALEVYQKSRLGSMPPNYSVQEKTADFWNDASNLDDAYTPATHSHSILMQCFEKDLKLQLPEIAEIFCKLGIGLSDAFVMAWKEKQEHFLIRPNTYIQRYIDRTWQPFIDTPPFPEFPSGHCAQIGAFEILMNDFFGKNFSFTDNRKYRGDRTFSSFDKAADEVVEARLLAGIHFRFSNEQGRELGNKIADNILKLSFRSRIKN